MPYGYNVGMERDNITLTRHRERISELMLQHHTKGEIVEIINQEFGITLSRRQVQNDMKIIQESWLRAMNVNYDLLMNQELARLDSLEAELWRQLRQSAEPQVREIIDRFPARVKEELSEEDVEFVITKIQTQRQTVPINPAYFTKIIDVQKERRRLLGIYAPSKAEVAMHHTIEVKGYDVVSPDDWDNVIEGNIITKVERIEDEEENLPEQC